MGSDTVIGDLKDQLAEERRKQLVDEIRRNAEADEKRDGLIAALEGRVDVLERASLVSSARKHATNALTSGGSAATLVALYELAKHMGMLG